MGVRDYFTEGVESRIVDEKILNVIRESDAGFVGTTEVVNNEDIGLKYDAVKRRLDKLESAGRVHSKVVGDPDNGTLAWYLDESERDRPVNPENYWAACICEVACGWGSVYVRGGSIVAVAAMMLLVVSLSTEVFGVSIRVLAPSIAGRWGYKFALAGFAIVALGGLVKLGSTVTEIVVERNSSPAE